MSIPPHNTFRPEAWSGQYQLPPPRRPAAFPRAGKQDLSEAVIPKAKAARLRELHDDLKDAPDTSLSDADVRVFNKHLKGVTVERNLWNKALTVLSGEDLEYAKSEMAQSRETLTEYAEYYAHRAYELVSDLPVKSSKEESIATLDTLEQIQSLLEGNFVVKHTNLNKSALEYQNDPSPEAADAVIGDVLDFAAMHICMTAVQNIVSSVYIGSRPLDSEKPIRMKEVNAAVRLESENRQLVGEVWDSINRQ